MSIRLKAVLWTCTNLEPEGSSVSVERVLSIGRDVISLRRASLSAETITALMNLRSMMLLKKRYQPQSGHKRPVSRLV